SKSLFYQKQYDNINE
nr:RecName: Full=Unknown protein 9 from 2D-page [Bombyx mori]